MASLHSWALLRNCENSWAHQSIEYGIIQKKTSSKFIWALQRSKIVQRNGRKWPYWSVSAQFFMEFGLSACRIIARCEDCPEVVWLFGSKCWTNSWEKTYCDASDYSFCLWGWLSFGGIGCRWLCFENCQYHQFSGIEIDMEKLEICSIIYR